ncbi:MAG: hypothetical protein OER88_06250 [Planctomycetota bacterium]|nr:hypothetical protein [Planctomycetota bacterium]
MRSLTLSLLLLGACTTAREYQVDQVSDSIALLRIVGVTVTGDATKVMFRYQADEQSRRIGVHPPGHSGAFVITDADGAAGTYALVESRGIATLPARTNVARGESHDFTLVFVPLPTPVRRVHISEGTYAPETGETSWRFTNVVLR